MLMSILEGAPIWAWPLLVFLIYLGFKATRQRTILKLIIYLLPLLGLLSVNAVRSLPAASYIWGIFTFGYLFGAWAGFLFQKKILLKKLEKHVVLAGEWLTFVVLMAIFWMNFLVGAVKIISPEIYGLPMFHIIFSVVAALTAGSFIGRSARVFKG